MPTSGSWATMLRIIGCALDANGAEDVKISGGDVLRVGWRQGGSAEGNIYRDGDMAKLCAQALLMRSPSRAPANGEHEELLRTLGQQLDEQNLKVVEIVERHNCYEVRGTNDDGPMSHLYSVTELVELSAKRQAQRTTT